MNESMFTPGQRRAALEVLGLDPNLTISVSLSADWATVVSAVTEDGAPLLVDGALRTQATNGPIRGDQDEVAGDVG